MPIPPKSKKPLQETNGAQKPVSPTTHQTHGGYTPITGPVLSAQQIYRGARVARSSVGTFPSLDAYGKHLRGMTTAELHRHAIEDARIVAIDDRDRLIKRLETEWTGTHARETHGGNPALKRTPFTAEQSAEQDAIRKKLLRG